MIFSCILLTSHSSRIYTNDATSPSVHSFDLRHLTDMNRLLFVNEARVHKVPWPCTSCTAVLCVCVLLL